MNSYSSLFALIITLFFGALGSPAIAQVVSPASGPLSSPSLTPLQEYAFVIRERNEEREYPELTYWGVRNVEWTISARDLPESALSAPGGASYRVNLVSKQNDIVASVQRIYAEDLEDRAARLVEFQRVLDELIAAYGNPTHAYHPPAIHGSQDAYVKGINDNYHVEWHGDETFVSLKLSDQELILEFEQSPNSRAEELRVAMKKTE